MKFFSENCKFFSFLLCRKYIRILLLCAGTAMILYAALFIRGQMIQIPEYESSDVLFSREGILLRTKLVNRQDYRFFCRLHDVSPYLIKAVVCAEDKRFFSHCGADMIAILRALYQNISRQRIVSGGSTITTQLVKLCRPSRRTFFEKLREFFDACALETHLSKDQILEQYLNRVFWGKKNTGIQAASLYYFNKLPRYLSLKESAMLAVMLRAPVRYDPVFNYSQLTVKADELLSKMLQQKMISGDEYAHAAAAVPEITRLYTDEVFHFAGGKSPQTKIAYYLQKNMQQLLNETVEKSNINNAVLLVYDIDENDYLVYCGNSTVASDMYERSINAAACARPPGSLLKPFLYYALFKKYSPAFLVDDSPVQFEGDRAYTPRNFDNSYYGKIPMREALACSRNIPAVRLLDMYGESQFIADLRNYGFSSLTKTPEYYGLSLVLGSGEVSPHEMVKGYALLARAAALNPEGYMLADVLSDVHARQNVFGKFEPAMKMAIKTGTSEGFYDSWAAAYNPHVVILAWCGNLSKSAPVSSDGTNYALQMLLSGIQLFKKDSISLTRGGWFEKNTELHEAVFCPECGGVSEGGVSDYYTGKPMKCSCGNSDTPLEILWPADESRFTVDTTIPAEYQKICIRCTADADWQINGEDTGFKGKTLELPAKKGSYRVSAHFQDRCAEIRVHIF